MVRLLFAVAALGALFATLGQAHAQSRQEPSGDVDSPVDSASSARAAEVGLASPYTVSAKVVAGQSWARALAGYDGAAQSFRAASSAEAALTGRLALRGDFEHGPSPGANDRVSFGARLGILEQETHGLDAGIGVFYQPNDFRREGKIAAGLLLGRRIGRLAVTGNAFVGSDPEGDDRELDARLATLTRVSRLVEIGLESRYRVVSSTDAKRVGTTTVDWELSVLPGAVVMLGRFALIGQAGVSSLRDTQFVGEADQRRSLRTGLLVMSGFGAAF